MSVNPENVIPIATAIEKAIDIAYANNTANANHENVITIANAIENAIVADADADADNTGNANNAANVSAVRIRYK